MRVRNLALNTRLTYLQQFSNFAKHFRRSPEELGPEEIRAYQVHLLNVGKLAPSSLGTATGALRFLYKVTLKREWAVEDIPLPKQPFKPLVILSTDDDPGQDCHRLLAGSRSGLTGMGLRR